MMSKQKQLTKRQLAVIEDLFAGELDEQAILDKHKISRNVYNRWLANERFTEQFNECIARAYRQSELIIARYAPLAAAKLVQLTESDKEETARKACLDIISRALFSPQVYPGGSNPQPGLAAKHLDSQFPPVLPAETASRLLAALAEEKNDG
ncbi:MAG: hypothetical protein ACETVZ_08295 [Phycisphaerae bacterium]